MKELFKTLRLAFYVLALPLVVTAVVSAQRFVDSNDDNIVDETIVVGESTIAELPPPAPMLVDVPDEYSTISKIDEEAGVSGRVALMNDDGQRIGAAYLKVTLNRRGSVVASAETDSSGVFRFEGLKPGSYTFIASSETALSAFGVYVVNNADEVPAAGQIQMDVVAVGEASVGPVREIMNDEIEGVEHTYMVDALVDNLPVASQSNRCTLESDGSLAGRVAPLDWMDSNGSYDLTGNKLMLYSRGQLAGEVALSGDGSYSIPDVEPGVYDLVSIGPHGSAAVCIEVVEFGSIAQNLQDSQIAVGVGNMSYPVLQGAGVVLTEPAGGGSYDITVEVTMPPGDGGGGGFGGGGGGGGLGGFGGLGELIGLGVGIWALSEIFDIIDRNNNNTTQQPVVVPPVVPPVQPPPASPAA